METMRIISTRCSMTDLYFLKTEEMKRSLKIYVYPHRKDDPFANVLLPVDIEPAGNYASESYFKKALMASHFITKDPNQAHLFFLPFSIARLRHDRRVGVEGIQDFVRDYMLNVSRRSQLAFFAGGINSPVREMLLQVWRNDSEIFVNNGRLNISYAEALLGSKFCLHVKGFEVNTARIADSLYYGCIPVIIANYYDLPFADILNWKSFSVVVATLDIPLLKTVLQGVGVDEYTRLRKNVLKGAQNVSVAPFA